MKEEPISFITAKLAKEKGYPQDRFTYPKYSNDGEIQHHSWSDGIAAPTQSLLQKWLREIPELHIAIHPIINPDNTTKWYNYQSSKQKADWKDRYDTYEEALEIALQQKLNLL